MASKTITREAKTMEYKVVEKNNHLAVHAICETLASAERWIAVNAVTYCARGFFTDKTLTPDSFSIVPILN